MIELIILNHLKSELNVNVSLEKQNAQTGSYVVFEKTGGGEGNHLPSGTFAFQSYGKSIYEAATLNEQVKTAVKSLLELDEIRGITLDNDYNFTDKSTKEYRYQAVYEIRYY